MLALSAMFAFVKLASEAGVHVAESLFWRQIGALPVVALLIHRDTQGWAMLRSKRHPMHWARAGVGIIAMALNFWAVTLLPLADAQTIGFAVPIFATIFAVFILREFVGWRRWVAILAGFIGVAVVIQPGQQNVAMLGAIVALAGAIMTALVSLVIRSLGRTEKSLSTIFWFSIYTVPPLALALPFVGGGHDLTTWGYLLGVGVFGALVQLAITQSLRLAPVSTVLPMDYTSLIWATVLGILVFGQYPDLSIWLGAPVIIGSGLFIAWREQRAAARDAQTRR